MESRLHVPAGDGVEGPRQPVAEAVAHLALVERLGARLPVRVRGQVLRERLPQRGHAPAVGPLLRGVLAAGDAAQQLLGEAAGLLGGQPAAAADGDAPVPRLPAPAPDAVVEDERLGPRGLDADPEADEPVVPGDPGLVGRLERLDRSFGEAELDLCGPFAVGGVHDASSFGPEPEGRCNPVSTLAAEWPGGRQHGRTGVRGGRLNASLTCCPPALYSPSPKCLYHVPYHWCDPGVRPASAGGE